MQKSYQDDNIYYMKSLSPGASCPDERMSVPHYHHGFAKELTEWEPNLIHSQCEFFRYQYETEEEFCELPDTILQNPDWCHNHRRTECPNHGRF